MDEGPAIRTPASVDPATPPSLKRCVVVRNPHGLHMRPAAAFVEAASRFQSQVLIWKLDRSVNGKSFLDLMMLAAEAGSELTLEVCGADAARAIDALCELLESPGTH